MGQTYFLADCALTFLGRYLFSRAPAVISQSRAQSVGKGKTVENLKDRLNILAVRVLSAREEQGQKENADERDSIKTSLVRRNGI